jgi:DNA-binding MarR family transcriptional regulator
MAAKGPTTVNPPALGSYLGYVLSAADRAIVSDLSEALMAKGVTVEQWRILRALSDGHGYSMGELAEAALMLHPTLTKAIDRLVDSALVYRRQDPNDRRRVAVYLSDSGLNLLAQLDHTAATHHRMIAESFGPERTEHLMGELCDLIELQRQRSQSARAGDLVT